MKKVLLLFMIILLTGCSSEVTISFNDSSLEPIIGNSGQVVTLPDLSREGYGFFGWYLDEGLTQGVNSSYRLPNEDQVLFPKWKKVVVINYGAGIGTPSEIRSRLTGLGLFGYEKDSIELPKLQSIKLSNGEEYIFENWYKEPLLLTPFSQENFSSENSTIYANYMRRDRYITKYLEKTYDGSIDEDYGWVFAVMPIEDDYVIVHYKSKPLDCNLRTYDGDELSIRYSFFDDNVYISFDLILCMQNGGMGVRYSPEGVFGASYLYPVLYLDGQDMPEIVESEDNNSLFIFNQVEDVFYTKLLPALEKLHLELGLEIKTQNEYFLD
jgi:hypothetical protein